MNTRTGFSWVCCLIHWAQHTQCLHNPVPLQVHLRCRCRITSWLLSRLDWRGEYCDVRLEWFWLSQRLYPGFPSNARDQRQSDPQDLTTSGRDSERMVCRGSSHLSLVFSDSSEKLLHLKGTPPYSWCSLARANWISKARQCFDFASFRPSIAHSWVIYPKCLNGHHNWELWFHTTLMSNSYWFWNSGGLKDCLKIGSAPELATAVSDESYRWDWGPRHSESSYAFLKSSYFCLWNWDLVWINFVSMRHF